MQEMIKKILEMDAEARRMTEDATSMRMQNEMSIEERKKMLKEEYIARARKKICELEESERTLSDEEWQETRQRYDEMLRLLQEKSDTHFDGWVDQLVKRTLTR